ncbi:hypothetical protein ASG62_25175 [Aureimonas sp. Leaf427]|nr:hypothetical protein ASG62_25175 [Aureimonas sp. Leaf427]
MPIKPEMRGFYPIDWPQLSASIRFRRAGGRCEQSKRPHKQLVCQLADGRWYEIIGNPTIADAVLDRLVHNAYRIELTGESLRKRVSFGVQFWV